MSGVERLWDWYGMLWYYVICYLLLLLLLFSSIQFNEIRWTVSYIVYRISYIVYRISYIVYRYIVYRIVNNIFFSSKSMIDVATLSHFKKNRR